MVKFLIDRLKERSTWLGIIAILTAAGVRLSPEQAEAIAVAGAAVAGAIAIFTADPQGPAGPQGPQGVAGPSGFIRLRLMAALLLICLALGSLAGCSTFKAPTRQQEVVQAAQQNAQTIVMGFQAAFKATPPIVTAMVQNGTISPHTFNAEILPAYNRGLASLAVVVAALQAAQDAQQDPNQTQAYTVALARFLTDKAAIDGMLTAFGGGAK